MLFNSIDFLCFFPVVVLLYYVVPMKARWVWLLLASYYFYMSWNISYGILIAVSTIITYVGARLIGRTENLILKKFFLIISCLSNLSVLFYYKYIDFIVANINRFFGWMGSEHTIHWLNVFLPVGISFYTFQTLGYVIDVYRKDVLAEKNIFKYALFVSFFPQLVAGPIEKSTNLLTQIQTKKSFSPQNITLGLILMGQGFFMKLVIADNLATVVDTVYSDTNVYSGWYLIIATILFAFQIYGDFGGYSLIAIGAARILGFQLIENFNAPYFSKSISEFWRRWHISLQNWFRDYIYIPLGGNKKGRIRQYINTMTVFLISGLWHGAAWHYVIWGGINGLFCVVGARVKSGKEKVLSKLNINRQLFCYRLLSVISTFVLIDLTWIFFRAETVTQAVSII